MTQLSLLDIMEFNLQVFSFNIHLYIFLLSSILSVHVFKETVNDHPIC